MGGVTHKRYRFTLAGLLVATVYAAVFSFAIREGGVAVAVSYAVTLTLLILACLGLVRLLRFVLHDPHPVIDERRIKPRRESGEQKRHERRTHK